MQKLRAVYRTVIFAVGVVISSLATSGSLLQSINIHTMFTNPPARDSEWIVLRDSFGGTVEVFSPLKDAGLPAMLPGRFVSLFAGVSMLPLAISAIPMHHEHWECRRSAKDTQNMSAAMA